MLGSPLPQIVCRRAHVLFTLFVFDYVLWCSTHIVFSVLFFFVLCTPCCQFLSIVPVASAINDRFFFITGNVSNVLLKTI